MKNIALVLSAISLATLAGGIYVFKDLAPTSGSDYMEGIDISNKYKGSLQWSAIGKDMKFVVLRAVRAIDTNRIKGRHTWLSQPDSNFQKNWASLDSLGITRGAYHFFAPEVPAEVQFEAFRKTVHLKKGDLPPILDVEDRRCNMEEANRWLTLARTHYGVEPILYSDYLFYKLLLRGRVDASRLWLYLNGRFGLRPSFNGVQCLLWQYSQDKYIPGFQDTVDLNRFTGDSTDWAELLVK